MLVPSKAALCKSLGISIQTLMAYENSYGSDIPRSPDGYNTDTAFEWFASHPRLTNKLRKTLEVNTGRLMDIDLDESEAVMSEWLEEKRKWDARRAELIYKKESGELVVLEEYIKDEAARYNTFKRNLEQLTHALPARLEHLSTEEMRKELQRSFDELLKQLQRDIR